MFLDDHATTVADDITFTPEEELAAYRAMLLIRRFEEKAGQLYALGAIIGHCPLAIGQEGLIVGSLMAARDDDAVVTGQRTHGHLLARGVAPADVMAELLGRNRGLSGGLGGSINMFAPERHYFGGHASGETAAAIATGIAFARKTRGTGAVTLAYFDDGAAARGLTYETFALAAALKLPVLFMIENAASPGSGIALGQVPSALASRGAPFAIPGEQVDGIDVRRTRAATRRLLDRVRHGGGPAILEMLTFRYRGHGLASESGRPEPRREETDPIAKSRQRILEQTMVREQVLKGIEREVRETVAAAAQAARAAPASAPLSPPLAFQP